MTKVLITGGTGFIGSALVRHLLSENYQVRVLARHKKNRFLLEGLDVEIADGDIIYPESVEKAMKGCSIVFDLASVYTFYPFWEKEAKALYKINVQGITNVLNAALKNKVDRFIHTSTIATIGRRADGKPSDETTGFDFKNASHYARSKYLAEQKVFEFCKKGLPAIILNPAVIIGERDYKPTPSGEVIVKFLNRSYPGYFNTRWAVADVDDIARAHIAAIKHGRIGERYILCNKKHYTLKEIFELLEEISGIKRPRFKIPYLLLLAFVYIDEFVSYKILKKKPIMPTEGVKFCKVSALYDNSKAVKELGYASTPFSETLAKATEWYRNNAYVEPPGLLRFKSHGLKIVKTFMKKIKIHRYADKLNFGTLSFFAIVKSLQFLKWLGLKSTGDGWRKVAQSYLRTEHAKFILATFRLNFWSDANGVADRSFNSASQLIIGRLKIFFSKHPALHWEIKWGKFCAKGYPKNNNTDIVHATFDKNGRIENITLYLDIPIEAHSLDARLTEILIKEIIKAYNKTRNIPDKKRPLVLQRELKKWLRRTLLINKQLKNNAEQIIDRILSATFIQFEKLSESNFGLQVKRFHPPCLTSSKHPGFGLINLLCRFTPDLKEVDLWFQFSHTPVDGVPMQEVLNDLKKEWGRVDIFKLPLPADKNIFGPELWSTKNHNNGVYCINDFIDFQPFLRLRKELNKRYINLTKGNITVAALLMWRLAQTRVFEDIKFAVPVDLRETAHHQRTLGFIFIRPGIYFDRGRPDEGFVKFQQEFNRQLRATRKRNSEGYKLLDSYAVLPSFMYSASQKLIPSTIGEFVGTVGITIIKKADFFIGPFSDVHRDGFIAISNLLSPAHDATRVCQVCIKGPKNKILKYINAIKEVTSSKTLS